MLVTEGLSEVLSEIGPEGALSPGPRARSPDRRDEAMMLMKAEIIKLQESLDTVKSEKRCLTEENEILQVKLGESDVATSERSKALESFAQENSGLLLESSNLTQETRALKMAVKELRTDTHAAKEEKRKLESTFRKDLDKKKHEIASLHETQRQLQLERDEAESSLVARAEAAESELDVHRRKAVHWESQYEDGNEGIAHLRESPSLLPYMDV